jgi:hypothetical protein
VSVRLSAASVLVLFLTFPPRAAGQTPAAKIDGPRPTALLAVGASGPLQRPFSLDSLPREVHPTHWKEGALVGGTTGGIALAILANGFCRSNVGGDCGGFAISGFLLGGFIGGFVGMLIGGQFPKDEWP